MNWKSNGISNMPWILTRYSPKKPQKPKRKIKKSECMFFLLNFTEYHRSQRDKDRQKKDGKKAGLIQVGFEGCQSRH